MAITKPSKKVLEQHQRKERTVKRYVKIAQAIAGGVDTPFWQALKEILQQQLKTVEIKLDGFEVLTPEQRLVLLTERRFYKKFIANEDHGLGALTDMLNQVKASREEYEAEFNEYHDAKKG